jgi:predicted ATPase
LTLDIESPITAISGLNGTGKSTLAQISTCEYKKPQTESENYKRHNLSNYFPVSNADLKPFKDDATVQYFYLTNTHLKHQELTVSRAGKQWDGYKRQPDRHCRYIGFTIYIPKVEQRDISIYRGSQIEISDEFDVSDAAKLAISKILTQPYEALSSATASHKDRKTDISFASKFGAKYSENHMGFGEGRVFYIVKSLESVPDQSLFVIEEPETSLHEHAQYELTKYFIDVAIRKKHQIILTTHSRSVLKALPRESRKLLYRDGAKIKVSNRTSTAEATGLLSLGLTQDKMILVEDDKAKTLLTELIRKNKPDLLQGIKISFVGNDDVVADLTKKFKSDGYSVCGVRDGDKGENRRELLYKLPGSNPPEIEVFNCNLVQDYLHERYNLNWANWKTLNPDVDFHDWPLIVSTNLRKSEEGFWEELCAIYSDSVNESELSTLLSNIET